MKLPLPEHVIQNCSKKKEEKENVHRDYFDKKTMNTNKIKKNKKDKKNVISTQKKRERKGQDLGKVYKRPVPRYVL